MQWDDLNWEKTTYSAFGAYQQSKLANVLFSAELASKLEGTGVSTTSGQMINIVSPLPANKPLHTLFCDQLNHMFQVTSYSLHPGEV